MNELQTRTESQILEEIAALQEQQKRNRPSSLEWQWASRELKPLFAEMARRQKAAK